MKKVLCFHSYDTIVLGHGLAAKLRRCRCGAEETFLFDRTKHAFVWVPGNFLEDDQSPIYIIAGSYETYLGVVRTLHEHFEEGIETKRVEGEADLDEMIKLIVPRIYLAQDWYESELIDNPKLRILLMYR